MRRVDLCGRRVLLAVLLAISTATPSVASPQDDARTEKTRREVTQDAAKNIKNKKLEKRLEAVESLGLWKSAEGAALLTQGLQDIDARVRTESARALGGYEKVAEPARQALQKALDDSALEVVAQAAEALERALGVSEKELAPARLRVLERGGLTDQFLAARSLVGLAPPPRLAASILDYIEHQLPGLSSADFQSRQASDDNLEIGETALKYLVEKTKDRAIIASLEEAARAFQRRNDVPLKILALYDPKPERWAGLLVDQLRGDPAVVDDVLFLMGRTAKSARDVATWAPAAVGLQKSLDKSVRHSLVYALGEAGGLASEHVDVALRLLQEDRERDVRETAAEAIGQIGDKDQATPMAGKRLVAERATPVLQAVLEKDPDQRVQEKAKWALARLVTAGGVSTRTVDVASPGSKGKLTTPSAPASGARSESQAMDFLRSRNEKFDSWSFHRALGKSDAELVQAFLDAGMSPNDPDSPGGDPPLSFLLRSTSPCTTQARPTPVSMKDVIRALLKAGANVNQEDANGNTALMAAGMGCDRETIALLLKAGAKLHAQNVIGFTAFDSGLHFGHDGLEELIAAGFRLTPEKAKQWRDGYKGNPKALAPIDKATAPPRK